MSVVSKPEVGVVSGARCCTCTIVVPSLPSGAFGPAAVGSEDCVGSSPAKVASWIYSTPSALCSATFTSRITGSRIVSELLPKSMREPSGS